MAQENKEEKTKDLKKLKRVELLDLLLELTEENETLRSENEKLIEQLQSKEMVIGNAGSIAEASLQLSGVFNAAQEAADRYLANIKNASANSEQILKKAELRASQIISDAEKSSAALLEQAKTQAAAVKNQSEQEAQKIWQETKKKITNLLETENSLKDLLGRIK